MENVVIVGAGIAGLTLARRLASQGVSARIIEARNHAGGRAESLMVGDAHFELGATWVWDSETQILQLIKELGLEVFLSHRGGDDLYESAQGVLRVQLPGSSVPEYRIKGGPGAIIRALESSLKVDLNTSLRGITYDSESAVLELEQETLRAKHVVMALPPALLGTSIAIQGAPDDQIQALAHVPVWMADMAKVVAVFDEPFWLEDGLSGRVFSHMGPMVEIHDMSGQDRTKHPALFGFVPRSRAEGDWHSAVQDQLVRLFGPKAASPRSLTIKTWWTEPRTTPAAQNAAPQLFGHPFLRQPFLGGRMHLGSTETAAYNTGHLDGAVGRANELARWIVAQL